MIRRILLFTLFNLLIINIGLSKTYIKEYKYQASEYDNEKTARILTLQNLKYDLSEEVGTYIESTYTLISKNDNQHFKQKIKIIALTITDLYIVSESWNGNEYYMKARVDIDDNDLKRKVNSYLKSQSKLDEINQLVNEMTDLELKIKQLKSKSNSSNLRDYQDYKGAINSLEGCQYFLKGKNLYNEDKITDAKRMYLLAYEKMPLNYAINNNLGVIYYEFKEYNKSIKHLYICINITPDGWSPYYNLGMNYIKLNQFNMARKCLKIGARLGDKHCSNKLKSILNQ